MKGCGYELIKKPTYEELEAELAEIKSKIRKCDISIIVEGGDMADNGWTRQDWSNKEIAKVKTELKEILKAAHYLINHYGPHGKELGGPYCTEIKGKIEKVLETIR